MWIERFQWKGCQRKTIAHWNLRSGGGSKWVKQVAVDNRNCVVFLTPVEDAMFVQIALLMISSLFVVSFLIVIVACMNAPVDERLDPRDQAVIAQMTRAARREDHGDLRVSTERPRFRFLASFKHPVSLPPQKS